MQQYYIAAIAIIICDNIFYYIAYHGIIGHIQANSYPMWDFLTAINNTEKTV
jgi:hypothetical protein